MDYSVKNIHVGNSMFQADDNQVENLAQLNIFVGANNSGKSRFLRWLFAEKEFEFTPFNYDYNEINKLTGEIAIDLEKLISATGYTDYGKAIEQIKKLPSLNKYVKPQEKYLDGHLKLADFLINGNIDGGSYRGGYSMPSVDTQVLRKKIEALGRKLKDGLTEIAFAYPELYEFRKIYIPTLRGLRTFNKEGVKEDIYKGRTIQDYFSDIEDSSTEIFTGLDMYDKVKELLLGNLNEREIIADFQDFLSEQFFDGETIALIPSLKTDVLNVKIGLEKEQPIYNLGDGIQSIIILTFPLFLYREQSLLVFIEEPELYLHPGMQRKLIETLMRDDFKKFQYFIATHSNHFLDLSLDISGISVYTFHKKLDDGTGKEKLANTIIQNVSNSDTSALELLGVRNSSIFLSNCTIWVEGITDRYYLRKYLQIWQKYNFGTEKYKEDLHYSFVEYSGGNITHWSFLGDKNDEVPLYNPMTVERICNKIFLISDKDSDVKAERQTKLKEKLKENYYCLNCREIENLLTKTVLIKVIASYEGADYNQLNFNKSFAEQDYQTNYLGEFIEQILIDKKRKGSYKSESGTVAQKVKFCERALPFINTIDDLSIETQALCEKIISFVETNNL